MSGAAVTISAAAAAKAAKLREEEEQMTAYKDDDLQGWEFKIVRSHTGKFGDYQFVQQVCQQEARAGWELLEKFDDNRLRFKRRVDERKNDRHLDIDPYRTNIGMNEGKMVIAILGIVAAAMALIFGVVWVLKNYQG